MKNILMYIIVIAVVGVGVWLFMQKGSEVDTADLYGGQASETPSPSVSASATSVVSSTPVKTSTPTKMITTTSGLQYQDEVVGSGTPVKSGDTVAVNYTGTFTDGKKFDSNVDPAFNHVEPFVFKVGAGQVIKGWDEGLVGMKVGGKRKLIVPASLGYGAQANGPIPANSTLVFEVELLAVQ